MDNSTDLLAAQPADARPQLRRPRQPAPAELARIAAENAIAGLTDAGRHGLRDRAVRHLIRIGDLPDGWESDQGQPWEPIIREQTVTIMTFDQAAERQGRLPQRHRRGA